jgi:PKD domain-containing protein
MPRRPSPPPPRLRHVTGALVLTLVLSAIAVVPVRSEVPTPYPLDPSPAPPPIPSMPAAGPVAPPAALVSDPITPEASCLPWGGANAYGGLWLTGQAWWEYRCDAVFGGCVFACNADLHPVLTFRDHFTFNGTIAVFYGEHRTDDTWNDYGNLVSCDWWWDEPTTQWYVIGGEGCPGEVPSPTATPAPTPTPNQAPIAIQRVQCEALSCSYDGRSSFDPDGLVVGYRWSFGDGLVDDASSGVHVYAGPGTYWLGLNALDDRGASGGTGMSVSPIVLTAGAEKLRGVSRVQLTWTGASNAQFGVLRNGVTIATTTGTGYTDELGKGRGGTYRYRVCQQGATLWPGEAVCSATISVAVP